MYEGDHVWLEVKDGKGKNKLGAHTDATFDVLRRKTRTFLTQRGELVERVNSDRVVKEPASATADTRCELNATPEDLMNKRTDWREWLLEEILDN